MTTATTAPTDPAVDVTDYDLVRGYIDDRSFEKNPIYLVPSLRSLRRTYAQDDPDGPWADIPRIRSRVGARGALPAQVVFWKPWTRSGKLVVQVLRDIQRDTPDEMRDIVCWRNSTKPFTGVTAADLGLSALSVGTFAAFMAVWWILISSLTDTSDAPSPAEQCVADGGTFADLGGGGMFRTVRGSANIGQGRRPGIHDRLRRGPPSLSNTQRRALQAIPNPATGDRPRLTAADGVRKGFVAAQHYLGKKAGI